jgi:hypothetical protein
MNVSVHNVKSEKEYPKKVNVFLVMTLKQLVKIKRLAPNLHV